MWRSEPQIPQASTLTVTSPSPGSGSGTSRAAPGSAPDRRRQPSSHLLGDVLGPADLGLELGGQGEQQVLAVRRDDDLEGAGHAARRGRRAAGSRRRAGRCSSTASVYGYSRATPSSVRSAPLPGPVADLGSRDPGDRRDQDVEVVEDPVDARGVLRLVRARPPDARRRERAAHPQEAAGPRLEPLAAGRRACRGRRCRRGTAGRSRCRSSPSRGRAPRPSGRARRGSGPASPTASTTSSATIGGRQGPRRASPTRRSAGCRAAARPPRRRADRAAGGVSASPGSGPAVTSSQSAVSATRRVRQPVDREPEPVLGLGREADPAALGLQPEEAAVGGRDPDRAAAVGGRGGADEAGGDGRAGAAAGAAAACGAGPTGCGSRPRARSR